MKDHGIRESLGASMFLQLRRMVGSPSTDVVLRRVLRTGAASAHDIERLCGFAAENGASYAESRFRSISQKIKTLERRNTAYELKSQRRRLFLKAKPRAAGRSGSSPTTRP